MIKKPLLSVIMPVYNEAKYIREAIDSVLKQSMVFYDFYIIDDASTDDTVKIIESYNDHRIRLIKKEKNSGYTQSLNQALDLVDTKYVARMDGDDICDPDRFKCQIQFLEANLDYILCGTQFHRVDGKPAHVLPEKDENIKSMLLRGNQFIHPSVMMRSSILKKNRLKYDVLKEPAEDYDLWVRLMPFGKFKNLGIKLLHYRYHDKQISARSFNLQKSHDHHTRLMFLNKLGIQLGAGLEKLLEQIYSPSLELNWHQASDLKRFCIELKSSNYKKYFGTKELNELISGIELDFIRRCRRSSHSSGFLDYMAYLRQKIKFGLKMHWKQEIKFLLNSFNLNA